MSSPLVTVIIPTYNRKEYLERIENAAETCGRCHTHDEQVTGIHKKQRHEYHHYHWQWENGRSLPAMRHANDDVFNFDTF